jgi:hypothetical protein
VTEYILTSKKKHTLEQNALMGLELPAAKCRILRAAATSIPRSAKTQKGQAVEENRPSLPAMP